LKILHVNFSDTNGGAARAAYRLHIALIENGFRSEFLVCDKQKSDKNVIGPTSFLSKFWVQFRNELIQKLLSLSKGSVYRSLAILPSRWVNFINESDADLVHLHWINGEMLSVKDISRIRKPIIWTLHDMWPFLGAEHLTYSELPIYEFGFKNKTVMQWLFEPNYWTYAQKKNYWKRPLQIVCPSQWLAQQASSSSIMQSWPITVIPNCLDLSVWKPISKDLARKMLNLPLDKKLVMFGSFGANNACHKGRDLLSSALRSMPLELEDLEIVILGKNFGDYDDDFGYRCHFIPHLYDDISLVTLYNAVDVVAVPSRIESFCQMASEAQACGVPVVAFEVGGLIDIVGHKETGYLAVPFSTVDFAEGLVWALHEGAVTEIIVAAREKMIGLVAHDQVVEMYCGVYRKILGEIE
jgi:glycosyltransferase involved in cell wall biosynthesis